MILAAGRGERMRPLTDSQPKPLLRAGGRALIEWTILALREAGIRDLVINHAHLGDQIVHALGDGADLGVSVRYSAEVQALETAGGIANALPLLGDGPFIITNGDVFTRFDYRQLVALAARLAAGDLGACVMVPNPPHVPNGDFAVHDGRLLPDAAQRLTYSGIGLYRAELFAPVPPGTRAALGPLLRTAAAAGRLAALRFDGPWHDIGTPERLHELDLSLQGTPPHAPA
ncbi:MAG: nucleotidyltransferase family protein [Burkholderiaceae bacterium]